MRSGRRLRVVLHRESRSVQQPDPFHRAIVGAGVAYLGAPERCVELLARLTFEGKTVVLRGDGNPPGRVVDDRNVDAAMPERHLVRRPPKCPAQQLVTEADAEQRDLAVQYRPGHRDDMVRGGRISQTVGQKDTVGRERE